jgi:hypothetical protein
MVAAGWLGSLVSGPAAGARVSGPTHHDALAFVARLHRQALTERDSAPPATPSVSARRPVTKFYVDAIAGRDSNLGTSPGAPWRTLARLQRGHYRGGDAILMHGRQRFAGTLRLGRGTVALTSARAALTIGSYGGAAATIAPRRGSGVVAINVAGVHVTGIEVAGQDRDCRRGARGIFFDARNLHGTTLDHGIRIDHVDVHGFCDGIAIGSEDDHSRFAHVRIDAVRAHDNGDAGVITYDPALAQHDIRDVTVDHTAAYRNDNQGGIVLFGVDGGVVDHSVASANGRRSGGGVGIWAFDANRIVLQHNESYGNLTTGKDGDGFDLDGGVSNSVMQYNYSHDNQGIGLLVCACVPYYEMHNDLVRFNISENDGSSRVTQPSGVYIYGGERFTGLDLVSNTAYSAAGAGPLVMIDEAHVPFAHVHVRNNVFVAGAGKPLLRVFPAGSVDLALQGNDWWAEGGSFRVDWVRARFSTLAAWRAATGVETLAGRPVGLSADPMLCALGQGGTVFPRAPRTLTTYRVRAGSPLLDAGLDLPRLFGTRVGPFDFASRRVTYGRGYDIGAYERQPGEGCGSSALDIVG